MNFRLGYKASKTKVIVSLLTVAFLIFFFIKIHRKSNDGNEIDLNNNRIEDRNTPDPVVSFNIEEQDSHVIEQDRTAEMATLIDSTENEQLNEQTVSELTTVDKTFDKDQMKNQLLSERWNIPKPKIYEKIEIKSEPRVDDKYCGENNLVIIFCMSTAQNVAHRNAVRDTWGDINKAYNQKYRNYETLKYKLLFVIGRSAESNSNLEREISEEIAINNDIIELNFEESRYEYTRKFMASMKWLNKISCLNLVFVLRVLDDIFLNVPPFMNWLSAVFINTGKFDSVYLGHIVKQDEPIRNIQHPLYTSEEDYPEKIFPDYIQSPVYLFSTDTINCMYKERKNVPRLPMEDAFIGLLAVRCFILPRHNEHFVLLGMPDNICHHKRMFFIGNIKPIEEVKVFNNLSKTNFSECNDILNNEL